MNVEQIAPILSRMTYEGLLKLDAALKEEVARRMDTTAAAGRTGYFVDSKTGTKRLVRVDSVNIKTHSVTELAESARPGMKWKVSKSMLVIDPLPRRQVSPVAKPTSARPITAGAGTW